MSKVPHTFALKELQDQHFGEADTKEVIRLMRTVTSRNAADVNQDIEERKAFGYWAIELFAPDRQNRMNEFNFKNKAAAEYARDYVLALLAGTANASEWAGRTA